MSHLSKIKTKITDQEILKTTLNDLKLDWQEKTNTIDKEPNSIHLMINNMKDFTSEAHLSWDGHSYELIADSNTWQQKRLLDAILEKIHQKYAHNIIMHESIKQGFNNIDTNVLQDGSLRIVLERWKN